MIRKRYIWPILIFILAFFLRFILLDKIPIGITGDELDYIVNAKAIFLRGSDITGVWFPFSLTTPPREVPKGEIPYLLMAPFIGLFDFSLFIARSPYALASSLLPVIMYFIVKKLIGEKEAIITGLLMAINPWAIFFGRTAYDTPLTVFFYFVGFYILLVTKRWHILFSFPFFFLAFFGYVGTKVLFLPFVAVSIFFVCYFINKKNYIKQYLVLFTLCVAIFGFFLLNLRLTSATTRAGDLLSPTSESVVKTVMSERQLAIENPINSFYINKLTIVMRYAFNNYIGAFSPSMLFAHGEQTAFISLRDQGFFYVIDVIFVVLGFWVLYKKNKKSWVLLVALALLAPLPSALSTVGVSHAIRSSMLIPIITIFIAVGIAAVISTRKYRYITIGSLAGIYILFLVNFLNNYMFRHPIYASETFNLSARLLSKYIDLAEENGKPVVFVTKDQQDDNLITTPFFKQYLFYTNSYNKNSFKEVAEAINEKKKAYKNISLTSCSHFKESVGAIVIIQNDTCHSLKLKQRKLSIARLSDGGEIYAIYDPVICSQYSLKRYPYGFTLRDFSIENMSAEKFCTTYVTELL